MRVSKQQGTGKHTIFNLTDDDMSMIYRNLPENNKLRNKIREHLVNCVTDEELEDTGVESAEQYITNWLGD